MVGFTVTAPPCHGPPDLSAGGVPPPSPPPWCWRRWCGAARRSSVAGWPQGSATPSTSPSPVVPAFAPFLTESHSPGLAQIFVCNIAHLFFAFSILLTFQPHFCFAMPLLCHRKSYFPVFFKPCFVFAHGAMLCLCVLAEAILCNIEDVSIFLIHVTLNHTYLQHPYSLSSLAQPPYAQAPRSVLKAVTCHILPILPSFLQVAQNEHLYRCIHPQHMYVFFDV